MRWRLAKEFGWTLDYIDTLNYADVHEFRDYEKIIEGYTKALNYKARTSKQHERAKKS